MNIKEYHKQNNLILITPGIKSSLLLSNSIAFLELLSFYKLACFFHREKELDFKQLIYENSVS